MVRSSLSALVIASSAVVLATSVVPSDQVTVRDAAEAPVGQSPFTARPRASQPASAAESRLLGATAGAGTSTGAPGVGTPSAAAPAGTAGAAARAGAAGDAAWAGTTSGATASGRGRWRWPLRPRPTVLRPFRAPLSAYGAGHRGLDVAAGDGVPVLAVEGGVVTHAGLLAGRGTITVTHADGLRSTYEPVDPTVAAGAVVDTGQVIGILHSRDGPGHCGARACLHLGARRGPDYLDPFPILTRGRLALLPLRP